jgi:predicted ester cyclase
MHRLSRLATSALFLTLLAAPVFAGSIEEKNKEINRRFVDEVYYQHKLDRIATYVSPDFIDRSPGATAKGPDGVVKQAEGTFALVPDIRMTVEHMTAEGDMVTIHWRAVGTSAAQGAIPAGKKIDMQGISLFKMKDGMIVESWDIVDRITMFRQLGFTMTPPAAKQD